MANQENIGGADPHEEIVRPEEHIEGLAAQRRELPKIHPRRPDYRSWRGLGRCPALPHRSAAKLARHFTEAGLIVGDRTRAGRGLWHAAARAETGAPHPYRRNPRKHIHRDYREPA